MTSETTETTQRRLHLRGFAVTWVLGCIVLGVAAATFAYSHGIPASAALPLALAFLTEFTFYLLLGFPPVLDRVRQLFTKTQIAAVLAASAWVPFLVYTIAARRCGLLQAVAWVAITTVVACWFLIRSKNLWLQRLYDVAFLAALAAVILSGILRWIFPANMPKAPAEVLGHISLIRTAILAALLIRRVEGAGIGFVPGLRDLAIGFLWFVAAAIVDVPLGRELGELHASGRTPSIWITIASLLGFFWVLALSEEFFFRGLLQQWLTQWTHSKAAGLLVASLLFGACHLGFRGFPNWRIAILAAVLGLCSGAAFLQARTIRASMVTHTLAVGAWRLFLG